MIMNPIQVFTKWLDTFYGTCTQDQEIGFEKKSADQLNNLRISECALMEEKFFSGHSQPISSVLSADQSETSL